MRSCCCVSDVEFCCGGSSASLQRQPKVDQIFFTPRVFEGRRSLLLPPSCFLSNPLIGCQKHFHVTVNVARGVCGQWSKLETTQLAFRLCGATLWRSVAGMFLVE